MKIYLLVTFLCLIFNKALSIETNIIYQIQNEIITNVDIKNEFKYLLALNNKLKKLDKVAYIRFASVYRSFTDIADFNNAIKDLD